MYFNGSVLFIAKPHLIPQFQRFCYHFLNILCLFSFMCCVKFCISLNPKQLPRNERAEDVDSFMK